MKKFIFALLMLFFPSICFGFHVTGFESKSKSYVEGELEILNYHFDPQHKTVIGKINDNGKLLFVTGIKLEENKFRVVADKIYIVEKTY